LGKLEQVVVAVVVVEVEETYWIRRSEKIGLRSVWEFGIRSLRLFVL
jgi:hypothetical protein